MKKHIILLSAAGLLFSSCGVYTKYKPATEVPDGLYGEEIATFTESTDGSPVAPEDSLDLGLGGMDWHELFTDPHLQALIGQGLQNNTDYQSAQLRVEEAEATLLSAKLECRNTRCAFFFFIDYKNRFIFFKLRYFEDFFGLCVRNI